MKHIVIVLILIGVFNHISIPCTTAIVSGKAARDGRPLLLKNRDSDYELNSLIYFNDGKYSGVGLINSVDSLHREIWAGMNSAGLAIMNSASYNLKPDTDTTKLADREGEIIRLALLNCATIDEFEQFLKKQPKPLGVEANFGVIDANGGAAYFETDNFKYIKYDVNDPSVAPNGYLIRTNYSFAGDTRKGYGHIRFETASELFTAAAANNSITSDFLLRSVARCLYHSATKTDLNNIKPAALSDTTYVPFQDFIPRNSTSAVVVVEGIRKGEAVNLTTMWAGLGFSLTSVVVPVWLAENTALPKMMMNGAIHSAPACAQAVKLKREAFSFKGSEKERYLNLARIINRQGTGSFQKASSIESKISFEARKLLEIWRKTGLNSMEVKGFYDWVDNTLKTEYLDN